MGRGTSPKTSAHERGRQHIALPRPAERAVDAPATQDRSSAVVETHADGDVDARVADALHRHLLAPDDDADGVVGATAGVVTAHRSTLHRPPEHGVPAALEALAAPRHITTNHSR
jgi:hypothetical protein